LADKALNELENEKFSVVADKYKLSYENVVI
jgi:hypothetical protein